MRSPLSDKSKTDISSFCFFDYAAVEADSDDEEEDLDEDDIVLGPISSFFLPIIEILKEGFLKQFGEDYGYPNAPKNIDQIRASEFKRLRGRTSEASSEKSNGEVVKYLEDTESTSENKGVVISNASSEVEQKLSELASKKRR